jgi:hypothetical protein
LCAMTRSASRRATPTRGVSPGRRFTSPASVRPQSASRATPFACCVARRPFLDAFSTSRWVADPFLGRKLIITFLDDVSCRRFAIRQAPRHRARE